MMIDGQYSSAAKCIIAILYMYHYYMRKARRICDGFFSSEQKNDALHSHRVSIFYTSTDSILF